jgi:mxaL protein
MNSGFWRRRWPAGALSWLAAWLLLALAWADPKLPSQELRWQHVVVVDITQSMNTRDMALPAGASTAAAAQADSRLAFVRHALQSAVAELPCGSSLGLGVFTEYRSLLLLAPLEVCAHYDELLAVIERLDGRMAWAAASEVSRGAAQALQVAQALPGQPSVVFISDGHESPPLRGGQLPNLVLPTRPSPGWVLGVGGDVLMPIPKFDPTGRLLGVWEADEVMQTDAMSLGRTVAGAAQSLVEADGKPLQVYEASGLEHLSSIKEPHLRKVAQAVGLAYQRLRDPTELSAALRSPTLAREVSTQRSWRWMPAALALLLLAWPYISTMRGARRR